MNRPQFANREPMPMPIFTYAKTVNAEQFEARNFDEPRCDGGFKKRLRDAENMDLIIEDGRLEVV